MRGKERDGTGNDEKKVKKRTISIAPFITKWNDGLSLWRRIRRRSTDGIETNRSHICNSLPRKCDPNAFFSLSWCVKRDKYTHEDTYMAWQRVTWTLRGLVPRSHAFKVANIQPDSE